MTHTLFQVRNLSYHYDQHIAFRDISVDVPKGQITAIIGPSGCGKSSLLGVFNRICELTPQAKVSGDVLWDGVSLWDDAIDPRQLRCRVGMIFQQPNPFPLTTWKNLELPLREHGEKNATVMRHKIERALKDVGLWDEVQDRLHQSALKLSGGQQQRLCIARALILSPEVLLMDEPCSALDPASTAQIEALIQQLRQTVTIVMVTHNLGQAQRLADQVIFLWRDENGGYLAEAGPKSVVFQSPQNALTRSYLQGITG